MTTAELARRIVEFDARYQATRSLPLGSSERRDAFLSAMQSSIDDAPTLAAAYLELREEVTKLAAENKSLDVLARGERAMVDTASDVIAELRAKLSECAAMGLEACRRLGVQDTENATLRAQLDAVTAQRDELREAAADFVSRVSNVVPGRFVRPSKDITTAAPCRTGGRPMSAITKPCETCAGNGRPVTFWNGVVDCADCAGTGRVPDVEATLRAENATLRESLERALVCLYGVDATLGDARKVPTVEASLRAELDAARAEAARNERELRSQGLAHKDAADWGVSKTKENGKLRAEVARLAAEVDHMTALYRKADDGHDENMRETARLIGEVDRLTADLATVRADHRTATGTLLAVAAAYNGWAIRGVGQHRAEYALEQIGKVLGKPEVPTC